MQRLCFVLALAIAAALVVAPWFGHVDDVDAQLYLVVARNMVRDRTWFDLTYLPDLFARFREHLPFGFWPAAAAIRLVGEGAVNPVYGMFTLATVAVAGWTAFRLAGGWAGVAAVLFLGTCESIWQYGGRLLLDPPLLLFATAAAAMALLPEPRWGAAAAFGAIGVLVKGPFGIVPLAAVVLGRAAADGSGAVLVRGAAAALCALAPAAAFLVLDRFAGGGSWWDGYLRKNVLASATGTRADGVLHWWYPVLLVAGRFWPGLPALAVAFFRTRDAVVRRLAFASVAGTALLCLPQRKWGNHAYVLFPLLAIAAGVAIAPPLDRWLSARSSRVAGALAATLALCWMFSLLGFGKLVLQPPCVVAVEFAPFLSSRPRDAVIAVAAPSPPLLLVGELAAERRLVPRVFATLPADAPQPAIAAEGVPIAPPWREISRARGWVLVGR